MHSHAPGDLPRRTSFIILHDVWGGLPQRPTPVQPAFHPPSLHRDRLELAVCSRLPCNALAMRERANTTDFGNTTLQPESNKPAGEQKDGPRRAQRPHTRARCPDTGTSPGRSSPAPQRHRRPTEVGATDEGRARGMQGPAIASTPAAHSPRGQTWIKKMHMHHIQRSGPAREEVD